MGRILLGDVLKPKFRALLETVDAGGDAGLSRIRKGLPSTWTVADKPGTGDTQTNDVVLARPPDRKPVMIAAYYESPNGNSAAAQTVMQEIGRIVGGWT